MQRETEWGRFRDLLRTLKDRCDVKEQMIADALEVSRTTISHFLNGNKDNLPVSRVDVMWLWYIMSDVDAVPEQKQIRFNLDADPEVKEQLLNGLKEQKKHLDLNSLSEAELREQLRGERRRQVIESRDQLRKQGPDELLAAAHFLPEFSAPLRVDEKRVPQLIPLVYLLNNSLLDSRNIQDIVMSSINQAITQLKTNMLSEDKQKEPTQFILEEIKSKQTMDLLMREKLYRQYEKGVQNVEARRRGQPLDGEEAIFLYMSMSINMLTGDQQIRWGLRIIQVQFTSISLSLEPHSSYEGVYVSLNDIGDKAERELFDIKSPQISVPPLIRTEVTYRSSDIEKRDSQPRIIKIVYNSSSTYLNCSTQTLALGLGFGGAIRVSNIETQNLGQNMISLVYSRSEITDRQGKTFSGDWVSEDGFSNTLQSLLIAYRKWLYHEAHKDKIDIPLFRETVHDLSDLYQRLNISRSDLQSYRLMEKSTEDTDLSQIGKDAEERLTTILDQSRPKNEPLPVAWRRLAFNLYRIVIITRILRMRRFTTEGNLSNARLLIGEIKKKLYEQSWIDESGLVSEVDQKDIDEIPWVSRIEPLRCIFEADEGLYHLCVGLGTDWFDTKAKYWEDWLVEAKKNLRGQIKPSCSSCEPSTDTYVALTSICGNAGRWEFYLASSEEDYETASHHFLEAAHYALRIGLTHRCVRWLGLAGRSEVRRGNQLRANQCLAMAHRLIDPFKQGGQRRTFQRGFLSGLNLLEAEIKLQLENDPIEALKCSLEAIRGALFLGLNRRIIDNLRTLSFCATKVGDRFVRPDLEESFAPLFSKGGADNRDVNILNNSTSRQVLDNIFITLSHENNKEATWIKVADRCLDQAKEILNRWHHDAGAPEESEHPLIPYFDRKTL